jgi:hypothetical protein
MVPGRGEIVSGVYDLAGMTSDALTRAGYAVLPSLASREVCSFLYEYVVKSAGAGKLDGGEKDVPGAEFRYADPFMESLLEALVPALASKTGVSLVPTFSYVRLYRRGDELTKHRDRPACELSLSLSLGYDAPGPWALHVESEGEERTVLLEPGDAMIYRGIEVTHWRDPFEGTRTAQVFLHYVNENGPHREWRFDKRAALGATAGARAILRSLMHGTRMGQPAT